MDTVADLEWGFRDTDGVEITIGAVKTWGHKDQTDAEMFGAPAATTSPGAGNVAVLSPVLTIPAQDYPALQVGAEILVGGVPETVRAFRPAEGDGALLKVLLRTWTHVVTVYRPSPALAGSRGRRREEWSAVASGVRATLAPMGGGLQPEPSGQEVRVRRAGFLPPAVSVKENDGILVTEGVGPVRYRVRAVAESAGWDTEVTLERTEEVFP